MSVGAEREAGGTLHPYDITTGSGTVRIEAPDAVAAIRQAGYEPGGGGYSIRRADLDRMAISPL